LVGARPVEKKKGADKGIDGRLYFHDGPRGGKTKQVLLSVKSGKTGVRDVRDLRAVVERERAELGALITMHPTTRDMRAEAVQAGSYESPWGKHPKIQLLTIAEILDGKQIDMPRIEGANVTFKQAPKRGKKGDEQLHLREEPLDYG
ncbi:MAG TPA: restriction endonuclease, partial [Candidatus Hydrogenedentes bacterium]|nr:restriction endonuclease [Candidatus Hydrogenedentota bacterium]HNT87111.1 restriction endonuclease [Candidatus Hydrogenedentota bacterium]